MTTNWGGGGRSRWLMYALLLAPEDRGEVAPEKGAWGTSDP